MYSGGPVAVASSVIPLLLLLCAQTKHKLCVILYQCVVVPSLECSMADSVITSPRSI